MNLFKVVLVVAIAAQPVFANPSDIGFWGRVLMSVAMGYWYDPEPEPATLAAPVFEQPLQPVAMPLEAQWIMIEIEEDDRQMQRALRIYAFLRHMVAHQFIALRHPHLIQLGDVLIRFRAWIRDPVGRAPRVGGFDIVPAFWTPQEHQWAEILRRQRNTRGRVEEVTE